MAPPPRTQSDSGQRPAAIASGWSNRACRRAVDRRVHRARPDVEHDGAAGLELAIADDDAAWAVEAGPSANEPAPLRGERSAATASFQLSVASSRIRAATGDQSARTPPSPPCPRPGGPPGGGWHRGSSFWMDAAPVGALAAHQLGLDAHDIEPLPRADRRRPPRPARVPPRRRLRALALHLRFRLGSTLRELPVGGTSLPTGGGRAPLRLSATDPPELAQLGRS